MAAHVLVSLDSVKADIKDFMLLAMHLTLLVVAYAKATAYFDTDASAVRFACFIKFTLVVPISVSGIFSPCYKSSVRVFVSIHWGSRESRLSHSFESGLEWRHVKSIFF
jgi:hypothetical protein